MATFTNALREAIQADGRSLRQLAIEIETTHTQLSRFVRGERTIAVDTLEKLAELLGVECQAPKRKAKK